MINKLNKFTFQTQSKQQISRVPKYTKNISLKPAICLTNKQLTVVFEFKNQQRKLKFHKKLGKHELSNIK